MFGQLKTIVPCVLALGLATAANAGTIRLTSLDGNTALSGEFVSFDGEKYTIKTIVGELQVDAFQVLCEGDDCPTLEVESAAFGISGSSKVVGNLFADLMFEFGLDIGGDSLTSIGTDGPTMIQLQNELGEELAEVSLMANGSAQGFNDLLSGDALLALTTRAVGNDEKTVFAAAGHGDLSSEAQQKIFALDALVIVTARSNPLRVVAEQDLAKIFSGRVTNWDQIGGPSAPINLYVRDPNSGTGSVFANLVMKPVGASLSPKATILGTDAEVASAVAADPLGIGITGFSDSGSAKVVDIRGVCGIQVPATSFTIKTEEYPLTRRIFAYTSAKDVPAQLNRFLRFLDTDAAQIAVANAGYVDLGVSYQSNDEQGLRYLSAVMPTDVEVSLKQLRRMTGDLMASDRMSITYRFALGSSQLDARARDDIQRLANVLATGDYQNKELLLIGFTDSVGPGSSNLALSEQRAQQVQNALVAAAPAGSLDNLPVRSLGYGEISPLSCNESDNGRRINRRVEVWLRDIVTVSR
ncbi:MAG: phosphate ABC transporter substrate-binding/OmpA family protein [Paracoccaceae bacterium]